jgi:hypothetical protein
MKPSKVVQYGCPVCSELYSTIKEAESCAVPKEPEYKIGEWVVVEQELSFPNPAFDDYFGGEDPYDIVKKGSIGKISEVSDENEVYDSNKAHPQVVYRCDKGEIIHILWIKEQYFDRVSTEDIERIKNRVSVTKTQLKQLSKINKDLEDIMSTYKND